MSIPLVQEATKDAINTSIIAIKRNIERINMLLGLSNSEEIDTSKFATKDELQQAVTDLQPVDEVALNNMHSISSNAVADIIKKIKSFFSTEEDTGGKWIDGKPIYRKVVNFGALPNTNSKRINHNISNMDTMIKYNIITDDGTYYTGVPRTGIQATDKTDVFFTRTYIEITTWSDLSQYVKTYVIIEYTKTTD